MCVPLKTTAELRFNTDVILKLVPVVIKTFNKHIMTHRLLFCGGYFFQHHFWHCDPPAEHRRQCLFSLKWDRWCVLCLAASMIVFRTRCMIRLSYVSVPVSHPSQLQRISKNRCEWVFDIICTRWLRRSTRRWPTGWWWGWACAWHFTISLRLERASFFQGTLRRTPRCCNIELGFPAWQVDGRRW